MEIKIINNLEEMQKYYDEKSNTYIFKEGDDFIDLIVFNFDLDISANIKAWDIKGKRIKAADIESWDIDARNIDAINIKSRDIKAWNINADVIDVSDITAENIYTKCFNAKDILRVEGLPVAVLRNDNDIKELAGSVDDTAYMQWGSTVCDGYSKCTSGDNSYVIMNGMEMDDLDLGKSYTKTK